MGNSCLLIIDMQVAMFSGESAYPYEGEKVLANIQNALKAARKTKMPIVFIQHTVENGEFSKNFPTWKICKEITPLDNEIVIEKSFRDSFHKTGLHDVLQRLDIGTLYIAGMQTEYCVDTTCRRAVSMGYNSILLSDAHTTFDSEILPASKIIEHHNYVLQGALKLQTTEDVIKGGIGYSF